jgi:hypothetical protein
VTNQETAAISVRRADRRLGMLLRRIEVQIDGQLAGRIQNGEERDFSVNAGEHSVVVRSPWQTSNTITVVVADGKTAQLDYEDNTKLNYRTVAFLGGSMGLLIACFKPLGLPSFAAPVCALGGYVLLQKIGLLAPMSRWESCLKLRSAD